MPPTSSPASIDRSALAVALVVVATVLLHLLVPLPTDVSWLINVNEALFDGRKLYADLLETNPPLAVWLYTFPVGLERLTGVAAEHFVILETTGAGLLSLWLSIIILRHDNGPTLRLPFAVALAILLLVPVESFGQREHFVVFGMLPALALAARRASGARLPGWTILVAGIGEALMLAIKLHFILVIALVGLFVALARRSWRPLLAPEHLLAAGLMALYGLVILLAYPAFLTDILPAVGRLYVPLRLDLVDLLLGPPVLLVGFALLAGLALRRRATSQLARTVWLAGLAALTIYLIQGKGWTYQLLPGTTLALLALAELSLWLKQSLRRATALALTALVALAPAIDWLLTVAPPDPIFAPLHAYGTHLTIAAITPDISIANPLQRALGDRLANSTPMLWRAAGARAVARHASPDLLPLLAANTDADRKLLADDLERTTPDLILADTGRVDWLAWAAEDPRIATILAHYTRDGAVDTHDTTIVILHRK